MAGTSEEPPKKRKPKGKSPTARSLEECRRRGWRAQTVEQTIPKSFIKRDLFHFGDVLAIDGQPGSLIIQATSNNTGGEGSKRVTKIVTECRDAAREWLGAGNRLEVWAWAKRGAVGTRKLWSLKTYPITADMVGDLPPEGECDGQEKTT